MNGDRKLYASKHFFDVEIAKQVGIAPAIIYENIIFWIEKNRANDKHFHDGSYWTYNSTRAFSELFPYLSEDQISRSLKKLQDANLIVKGNFNEKGYDRTTWFSIPQNCEMDVADLRNASGEIAEPIPDINTDINTDISIRENKQISLTGSVTKERKSAAHQIQEFFQNFWLENYDMPCRINLFKIQEIDQYCQGDFDLFLRTVDKFLKDPFWGDKALSPELMLKGWHTLGNINKIEAWKRLGYKSEEEYKKSLVQSNSKMKKAGSNTDEFVKLLKGIKEDI